MLEMRRDQINWNMEYADHKSDMYCIADIKRSKPLTASIKHKIQSCNAINAIYCNGNVDSLNDKNDEFWMYLVNLTQLTIITFRSERKEFRENIVENLLSDETARTL